jgi:hypothetical protein
MTPLRSFNALHPYQVTGIDFERIRQRSRSRSS